MPIDLKRQGRAEEHLALFYPQSLEERDQLFRVIATKCQVDTQNMEPFSTLASSSLQNGSGADIEAAIVRAKFRALTCGRDQVTSEDMAEVLANFIPPSYPLEIELQNLVAAQECTNLNLLPDSIRKLERTYISHRIHELKLVLDR